MSIIASLTLGGDVTKRANFNNVVGCIPFSILQVIDHESQFQQYGRLYFIFYPSGH